MVASEIRQDLGVERILLGVPKVVLDDRHVVLTPAKSPRTGHGTC